MKPGKLVLATILVALCAAAALAQSTPKSSGSAPKYDLKTETKVKGTIQEVKDFHCPVSGGMGAHITLKTSDKPVMVHLALSKFLKEYDFTFASGEDVEVIGSKVKLDGEDVILARQVTRGQNTFTFRDKEGKPLW